jgi:enamine deaminase RidA (YjgF/YER057c/UK114 family)
MHLGIELPAARPPVGNFVQAMRLGSLVFSSGQGPVEPDGRRHQGRVGEDVTTDQGYQHAKLAGINLLAALKAEVGSLDRVRRIVKIFGMVNAAPSFGEHPEVINGCSDLMMGVFRPESGRHARSPLGWVPCRTRSRLKSK